MTIIPDDYPIYAECIRSDQLSAAEVAKLFEENPEFKAWYLEKYNDAD